ncbi:MAG: tRNA glutamyl-Q(34) synthetase GluQRS [Alphaproteobacteria bacterium]|nr:tRNA glutamyl-Q(34) synthetase GluQRS [Alphaproteobacteria bacterium]
MNATDNPPLVTRFAPSPTGLLHLGHAYATLFAWRLTQSGGGRFLMRIEDIDQGRCRPEFEDAIFEDMAWLGIEWETPVLRQSERIDVYAEALDRLDQQGLLYPCFCTRADIAKEIEQSSTAPHTQTHGPDGPIYPGICKALDEETRAARIAAGEAHALRLDMDKAVTRAGSLTWFDRTRGEQTAQPEIFGDVVLARKDIATSYHLAVTIDDAAQGVTLVTRGEDLLSASHVHRLLQALLGLDVPEWHHMPLLANEEGIRLAKRDKAFTLRAMREAGTEPEEIWAMAIRQIARAAARNEGI